MASRRPRRDTPSAYARRPSLTGEAESSGAAAAGRRRRGRPSTTSTSQGRRRPRSPTPDPVAPTLEEEYQEDEDQDEDQVEGQDEGHDEEHGAAPEDEGGAASGVYQRGPAKLPPYPLPQSRALLRPVPPK
jgi:hypothetical protein